MTQDEWAEKHPNAVQWFTSDDCPLPLCRYRNHPKPRHHHLNDTLRHYEKMMASQFPFMAFYAWELHNVERSANRRAGRKRRAEGEASMLEPVTISALHAAMAHAIAKHGWHQTPLNPNRKDVDNLPILVEEIGEVARAMTYDEGSRDALVKELLQTAAMALSWAQAVDTRIEADKNRREATALLEEMHNG